MLWILYVISVMVNYFFLRKMVVEDGGVSGFDLSDMVITIVIVLVPLLLLIAMICIHLESMVTHKRNIIDIIINKIFFVKEKQ